MQRRSGLAWTALAPVFAAMILASCAKDLNTGPRLATLVQISGDGQAGAIGATLGQPFVIKVVDQSGAPVKGEIIVWQVTSGGGSVSASQTSTDDDGLASTSLRLGTTIGPNTVRATLGDLDPVVFTASATAAPPTKLTSAGGDGQTATVGTLLPVDLSVEVTDAVGNPKQGVLVTFAVTSGGGTLSATSAVSNALGVASVHWTLGTIAGTQSTVAIVSGLIPVTFTATGRAGAPDALTILTGNNQTGTPGAALTDSLRVRLADRFGNPVSGVSITFAPNASSGTVSPTVVTTDVNGRAATRWTLGSTGGPKQVTATGGGFTQTFNGGGNVLYLVASAGGRHSCGLAQGGVEYCWGYNGDGQLGIGVAPAGSGPVFALPQPSGTSGNLTFGQISSGRFHNCSLTLAGVGYCWGLNVDGRLGSGNTTTALTPTAIVSTRPYSSISAGQTHSCSIDLAGRAFCWGGNADGQLGIIGGPVVPFDSLSITVPTAVQGGLLWAAISAGGLHTCAIDNAGTGWCWGNNASGQLGDGTTNGAVAPRLVAGGGGLTAISAGNLHTCALNAAGAAMCWGSNVSGQLGTGAFGNSSAPTAVTGGLVFAAISAGQSHTCGVTAAGAVYCWGSNAKGQLGDGSLTTRTAPTLVSGALVFRSISAGDLNSCGVTTANVAYCWGDNEFGQLGDGTTTARLTPTRVAFQP
jgi:alpha-tubulin suppressor-like RCC1 family protein